MCKVEYEMEKRGFREDFTDLENRHKKHEELEKSQAALNKLQKRLSLFHDLPHDVHLAQIKLEEKRTELQDLEKQLLSAFSSFNSST